MNKLINLYAKKKKLEIKIKQRKRKLHIEFVRQRQQHFKMLNYLIIAMVLFNFGTVFLNNIAVAEERSEQGIVERPKEVNPIQAKLNNLEMHPDYVRLAKAVLIQLLLWFLLIMMFVWVRTNVYSDDTLIIYTAIIVWYFVVMGWNFFNDLGVVVGWLR